MQKSNKSKDYSLEDRLYTARDAPDLKLAGLYMPESKHPQTKRLWEKLNSYWEEYHPKTVFQKVASVAFPREYTLWKMPVEMHGYIDKLLEYATAVCGILGPQAKATIGLTHGISHVVYGLKTKSGKMTGTGLAGIIHHLKSQADEKMSRWLSGAEYAVGKYFQGFHGENA